MSDIFDDLIQEPNTVKIGYTKKQPEKPVRYLVGTMAVHNKITKLLRNDSSTVTAYAYIVYNLAATEDGNRKFADVEYKKFKEKLDFNLLRDLANVMMETDDDADSDNDSQLTLNAKTQNHVKNSSTAS